MSEDNRYDKVTKESAKVIKKYIRCMENKNYNQSLPPLEPGTFLKDGQFEIKELTSNRGGFGRI